MSGSHPVVRWALLFVPGGGRQGRGGGKGGVSNCCPCRPAEDMVAVRELGDGSPCHLAEDMPRHVRLSVVSLSQHRMELC